MPDQQHQQNRQQNQTQNQGALAEDWRKADRTDYWNTSGEEDMTIWDAMVNAVKPDLRNRNR